MASAPTSAAAAFASGAAGTTHINDINQLSKFFGVLDGDDPLTTTKRHTQICE
jgi:hypothetical protein